MIARILEEKLHRYDDDRKALIIMGPRQTGKTTLLQHVYGTKKGVLWLNGDEFTTREFFDGVTTARLRAYIGDAKYVIIDEAQRIRDIGIKLKLITDHIQTTKLVVTGSSSFELSSRLNEPLTGRKWEMRLYPISFLEMVRHHGLWREREMLEERLVFGYYPEVVVTEKSRQLIVRALAGDYLYKDLLIWNRIKKAEKIQRLLQALAFQVGHQVSYLELSRLVGLDKETVESYIDLLEKAFVIFRLGSFRRNLRTELNKSKKIYFWDTGIRNALISNFSPLNARDDVGALWENFLIAERLKYISYFDIYSNCYFWRTKRQQEIDYVEERDGKLHAYEFKWNPSSKWKPPGTFSNAYPDSSVELITPANFESFLGVTNPD